MWYRIARKFDRKFKFGGLAVRVENAKLKSTNIIFTRNGHKIPLWKLLTWHCCNSSQSAGCRSWVVCMNLHSNSVPHNMWSVVCKVDLKRIGRGWSCDHCGCCCDCGCVWCSSTCQKIDECTQSQKYTHGRWTWVAPQRGGLKYLQVLWHFCRKYTATELANSFFHTQMNMVADTWKLKLVLTWRVLWICDLYSHSLSLVGKLIVWTFCYMC